MLYSANNSTLQMYIDKPTDNTASGDTWQLHLDSLMGGASYDLDIDEIEVMDKYYHVQLDITPVAYEGEYKYILMLDGHAVASGLLAFGNFHADRTDNRTLEDGVLTKGGYGIKPEETEVTTEYIQYEG